MAHDHRIALKVSADELSRLEALALRAGVPKEVFARDLFLRELELEEERQLLETATPGKRSKRGRNDPGVATASKKPRRRTR